MLGLGFRLIVPQLVWAESLEADRHEKKNLQPLRGKTGKAPHTVHKNHLAP